MLKIPSINFGIPRYNKMPPTTPSKRGSDLRSPPATCPAKREQSGPPHKHSGKDGTLEKSFLELMEAKRLVVSCGQKHSGKSYVALHYLMYAFKHNLFDVYLLVLPTYAIEENDSYKFIREYKGHAHIIIYNKFDDLIIKSLVKMPNKQRKFLMVDDATGMFDRIASQDSIQLVAQLRHYNASGWLIFHLLSGAMPRSLRSMTDCLFIHMNSNRKTLEQIYYEYLSLCFDRFDDFLKYYKTEILSKKYNSLFINTREVGAYDSRVNEWNILKL